MASTHHGVVYTKKWVVDLILDVAGYVPGTGISDKVIIEPSCGCGPYPISSLISTGHIV